jgi:prepilin-type N-terminal cleavage/methylation domain-containing protein
MNQPTRRGFTNVAGTLRVPSAGYGIRSMPTTFGFTLVELLIVIAIIGTLVGLLLPAINAARARARQTQCLNNIKQLSTAVYSYATSGKSTYPGWVQIQRLNQSLDDEYDGGPNPAVRDMAITWAGKILPQLDQQGLWDQITDTGLTLSNLPRLEVFLCPDDAGTNTELPKLTYVGNTGYYDNQPNTNQLGNSNFFSDVKANGLMHDLRPGRGGPTVRYGSADIKDGADMTILLSENIHKDEMIGNFPITWLGVLPPPTGGSANYEQAYGIVWTYYPVRFNDPSKHQTESLQDGMQAPLNRNTDNLPDFGDYGRYFARPAADHPEAFNVAFAGSGARSINPNIEYRVYQQLMTPNGAKAEALDSNHDMRQFMEIPLKESDY